MKKNNHKNDIYREYIKLKNNEINYKDYIDKYKFTHILINKSNSIYDKLQKNSYNYTLVKEFDNYSIYVRNDFIKEN